MDVMLALLVFPFFHVLLPCFRARSWVPSVVPALVISGLLLVVYGLITGYIHRFLEDFIVPIMYKFGVSAVQAWGVFMGLLGPNFWRLVLYGLFYWVLGIGAGICVMVVVLLTCCIAGCLMAVPYLGAVVLLPVTVFFRSYSIEYLGQFGPEFVLSPGDGKAIGE